MIVWSELNLDEHLSFRKQYDRHCQEALLLTIEDQRGSLNPETKVLAMKTWIQVDQNASLIIVAQSRRGSRSANRV